MSILNKWALAATLACLAGLMVTPARAQFNPPTQAVAPSLARQAGFNPGVTANMYANPYTNPSATISANPYGYTPPWINYNGPVGGALTGASDVINAQGGFAIQQQQAVLVREQIKAERIANKRRAIDAWLYQREHLPTPEEERERTRLENVMRSRNNPPITEITSGKALNDLLVQLQILQKGGQAQGPNVPLNPDLMNHVNITASQNNSSLGVLRNSGRLQWPLALQDAEFQALRTQINGLAPDLVSQASGGGPVDGGSVATLSAAVDRLQAQLKRNGGSVPADQYIQSKRFLNDLESAVKALQDPNVSKYASGKWAARGRTVADLLQEMTTNGLRFAAATPGDEAAYVALQRALAAYTVGMSEMVAK
jgi:hypothetical protein